MWLAKDGIFPITRDAGGHSLPLSPASGFRFPGTVQGEGKLCGIPSLFIRLAGCNLHCCWQMTNGDTSPCDTLYATNHSEGTRQMDVEEIVCIVRNNTPALSHLVITGGEPFLQAEELKILCARLKEEKKYHLTIETNATLFHPETATHIDLFSLSPKLSSSQGGTSAVHTEVIQSFISFARENGKDFQLKFVYSCPRDIEEIEEALSRLTGWRNEDILLMPLGGTPETLQANTLQTLEYCIRKNWRYCDRLHIALFGDKAGV